MSEKKNKKKKVIIPQKGTNEILEALQNDGTYTLEEDDEKAYHDAMDVLENTERVRLNGRKSNKSGGGGGPKGVKTRNKLFGEINPEEFFQ